MAGEDRRVVPGVRDYRSVPTNLESEAALLGAVLLDNNVFRKVAHIVTQDMFFEELHRRTWHILNHIISKGLVATPAIVKTYLPEIQEHEEQMTTGEYLTSLMTGATTTMNAPAYAKTIRDLHYRRLIIGAMQDGLDEAFDCPVEETADTILSRAIDKLAVIRPNPEALVDFEDYETIGSRVVQSIQDDRNGDGAPKGLSTGYLSLDAIIGGLEAPDLIVLAGRPGSGKTALATNIAFRVAKSLQALRNQGERTGVVGFYSLEMSSSQLTERILADATGIAAFRIKRRKNLTDNEMRRIVDTHMDLRKLPLLIDQTGKITLAQLEMRARRLKQKMGLELLVIDYLQLITGRGRTRDENRVQEVSEITSSLKALAKELGIPVIALAQVSRRVDERPIDERRPRLSDLRESGSIEQDADMVIFMYREEYYLRDIKPKEGSEAYLKWEADCRRAKGVAEAIVAKQRHGAAGTAVMGFRDDLVRFMNEPEERDEPIQAEERRREKRKSLHRDATALYGILRGLMTSQEAQDPGDQLKEAVPDLRHRKGAKVIPLEAARKRFGLQVLGDADEKTVEREFRTRFKELVSAEHARYAGNAEVGFYVYVADM